MWLEAINADLIESLGPSPIVSGQRTATEEARQALCQAILHGLQLRPGSAALVIYAALSIADYALVLERLIYDALLVEALSAGEAKRAYNQRVRTLAVNLKHNAGRLVQYDPVYLASANIDELGQGGLAAQQRDEARAERKELLRKIEEEKKRLLESDYVGLYQCNNCKSWKTTYYLLQTRSADEPMTCFISCLICGKRQRR